MSSPSSRALAGNTAMQLPTANNAGNLRLTRWVFDDAVFTVEYLAVLAHSAYWFVGIADWLLFYELMIDLR
jgi:hypothetical protein